MSTGSCCEARPKFWTTKGQRHGCVYWIGRLSHKHGNLRGERVMSQILWKFSGSLVWAFDRSVFPTEYVAAEKHLNQSYTAESCINLRANKLRLDDTSKSMSEPSLVKVAHFSARKCKFCVRCEVDNVLVCFEVVKPQGP